MVCGACLVLRPVTVVPAAVADVVTFLPLFVLSLTAVM